MNDQIILKANNIHKSFVKKNDERLEILKGVSLDVIRGKISVIIGASGAGKSTLLHILSGLDTPDKGEVNINSTNLFSLSDDKLSKFRNKHIGFVFQFHHLLPEFTAQENVLIPTMIAGKKNVVEVNRILEDVGITDRAHHKPSEISGGEAQRVAIARALVNSPDLILADEPTGNLDTENADAVINLIFSLREKYNQTYLIVTHNEEFAQRCDRIIKISDGIII